MATSTFSAACVGYRTLSFDHTGYWKGARDTSTRNLPAKAFDINPSQLLAVEDIYHKRIIFSTSIWMSLVALWVPWVTSRSPFAPVIHVPVS